MASWVCDSLPLRTEKGVFLLTPFHFSSWIAKLIHTNLAHIAGTANRASFVTSPPALTDNRNHGGTCLSNPQKYQNHVFRLEKKNNAVCSSRSAERVNRAACDRPRLLFSISGRSNTLRAHDQAAGCRFPSAVLEFPGGWRYTLYGSNYLPNFWSSSFKLFIHTFMYKWCDIKTWCPSHGTILYHQNFCKFWRYLCS